MNRKFFLRSLAGLGAYFIPGSMAEAAPPGTTAIIPHTLRAGDLVGITSPAGYILPEDITPAVERLEAWGFRVKTGAVIGSRDFGFGGTDEARAADFQQMLDDKNVRAILCARGGYGLVRIIDKLDFSRFAKNPKWIIGFSDITVLHCHLNRNFGIATIHSKMCNSFPSEWDKADPLQQETINSIFRCLTGDRIRYQCEASPFNRLGNAEGALVGGNLRTIESLAGSRSDLRTTRKILFVEDVGEYLYSIDRMFWNLKRSGKLDALNGLIIGGFRVKPDDPGNEFGRSVEQIVMEKVKEYDYPVCFNFPVGHHKENYALKTGVRFRLSVAASGTTLKEI